MEYGTYFLCAGLSVLVGCAAAAMGFKKHGIGAKAAGLCVLCALVFGSLGARVYYIACYHLPGAGMMGRPFVSDKPYEYAACGAVLGVMAGCAIGARLSGLRAGKALDILAPGALAALALERISEVFADSAWGVEILDEGWQFFPIAVRDAYGDYYGAVNLPEAAAALAVLFIFLRMRPRRDGARFALSLLWWSMGQILCESLRAETLRWGFVRVQQVQCAVFGAAVLLWALKRVRGMARVNLPGIYLAGVGAVIALEFALDRLPWPKWLDYALMALTLLCMGAAGHAAVRAGERQPVLRA